jgi:glycosyltransferase involved in cell wall biosynthesis
MGRSHTRKVAGADVKILTFVTHPIQYQYPLFTELADAKSVDLEVCYYTTYDGRGSVDPGFGRQAVWDVPVRGAQYRQFRAWGERGAPEPARTFSPAAVVHALRSRPDVVLLHSGMHAGDIAVLGACRARGTPTVCRPETLSERERGKPGFVVRSQILRSIDALCAIGTRARRRLMDAGVPSDRISLSPYTVDVARFAETRVVPRETARARVGIPEGLAVVLFAGKLIERKRPLDVVRAMRLLPMQARLVVAGDGSLRDEVDREARRLQIPITQLGFVNQSEIPYVYRAADVLALPSDWEPWGLAVNEAMACGTPAVCSTGVSAGDDLVRPVSDTLVHATGDEEALAVALGYALSATHTDLERRVAERIDQWTYREAVAGLLEACNTAVAVHG